MLSYAVRPRLVHVPGHAVPINRHETVVSVIIAAACAIRLLIAQRS
jgi:hypothetical protein